MKLSQLLLYAAVPGRNQELATKRQSATKTISGGGA